MSLRFYFGPSGAGKSRLLYEEIIQAAGQHPHKNYLVIVPDQFTMQTQKDFVLLSDRGGIMNIDVLSFGRLGHRILEEVGSEDTPVLDDTGKSLVLQKVASGLREELPALGGLLNRQGYIHEIKSVISEFKQYGIGVDDVDRLIEFSAQRGALNYKLKDLKAIYKGFQDFINGSFITTEETMDVLRNSLHRSRLIPGSVVVFDGFTGFTPIQYGVIRELLCLSEEVILTVTMGVGEDPYTPDEEQKLFHLGKKTVCDLERLAKQVGIPRGKDRFIIPGGQNEGHSYPGQRADVGRTGTEADATAAFGGRCEFYDNTRHRFMDAPALLALEQGLFRYPFTPYGEKQDEVFLFETTTPADEVHQMGLFIKELVQKEGLSYRDIAVITGDLEGYAPFVEREFGHMEIPCYIDRTRGIRLNPMIEFIKSAISLYIKDFTYEAVFHYLRSGMADIPQDDVDNLENYVLQTGIRGKARWEKLFTRKTDNMQGKEEALRHMNEIRERFMSQVEKLNPGASDERSAGEHVRLLYNFLVENQVQKKLADFEKKFHDAGDLTREREYAQIYRLVMELLEQIHDLLGDEVISRKEFYDILEAGFGEIEVGTIPQNVDRVLVGDMERTRLKQVKVLFFAGLNDGNIPKKSSKGGLISDHDREFLRESDLELAPSPRQQMFIQRLYLYLNMTKPSKKLYLSYAKLGNDGKSLRPSYLVEAVKKLLPGLEVQYPQNRSALMQIATPTEGMRYLAEGLREYNLYAVSPEREQEIMTVYTAYGETGEEAYRRTRDMLTEAAFSRYRDTGLSKAVARALYGVNLENSTSRLETYAACAYRHFLQYGLSLKEREEFGFEAVDLGNVYHGVLELFARKIEEKGYTWMDFPREFAKKAVGEALEQYAAEYGNTVLYANARNEYAITRMNRILLRTVMTIQSQLKKGAFLPDQYELSFGFTQALENIHVSLSEDEKMHLRGRIDRVDTASEGDNIYVKVIDYKSGSRQFDIAALYYGLQLQLVIYMNVAVELIAKKNPSKKVIPAAMLYYHIDDPTIEAAGGISDEEIDRQIQAKLRMNGVVNESPEIIRLLDNTIQDRSDVIPVEKKKDGSFSARSSVMSSEELQIISGYVSHKIRQIGREMLDGKISINPYEKGNENACTYCAYRNVCGLDQTIPGYEMRKLEVLDKATALEKMREEM